MMMRSLGHLLLAAGALIFLVGLLLVAVDRLPFFSWIGRLPGDIRVEGRNFHFYFPIVTCLVLSALVTLIVWLVRQLGGR